MRQKALNVLVNKDSASMDVDIVDSKVAELRERLGDVITDHLLQKPNEALIAELLASPEGSL